MKVKVEIMEQFLMMPMTRIVTLQNDGIHEYVQIMKRLLRMVRRSLFGYIWYLP